jgi:hypothetical protein
VFLRLLVEERQPDLHPVNDRSKFFRSSISVGTLVLFILAISTLQILSILISETPQSVYGQTQATYNSKGRDLSWASPSLYNDLKPTTSNVITMAATSISDNGNNNTTPFLLPLPSSSRSSDNNSSPTAVGLASNTSPSNKNVVNSHSPSQGHTISQTNIVSSNDNHVENQHKKHNHGSTGDPIHQVIGQGKKQFTAGDIPFP